jgi:hypothetical protein
MLTRTCGYLAARAPCRPCADERLGRLDGAGRTRLLSQIIGA